MVEGALILVAFAACLALASAYVGVLRQRWSGTRLVSSVVIVGGVIHEYVRARSIFRTLQTSERVAHEGRKVGLGDPPGDDFTIAAERFGWSIVEDHRQSGRVADA